MTSIGRRVRRSVVIGGMVHGMTPSRFAKGRVWPRTCCAVSRRARLGCAPDAVWFDGLTLRPFPFFHQFSWLERVVRWLFFLCMRDGTDSDV